MITNKSPKGEQANYSDLRKEEYPTIQEQLDIIFHEGLDAWRVKIQEIKDKHPKPE